LNGIDTGTEIWISYVQIYCESLTDLLNPNIPDSINPLLIREKSNGAVYVEGLSRARITNINDFNELLLKGDSNRFTASTNLNEVSSRSHAALIVTLVNSLGDGRKTDGKIQARESSLVLVDLAGSER
jgi:hypothetical protein